MLTPMATMIWAGLVGAAALAVVALLLRRVLFPSASGEVDARWLAAFSVDSYQPLARLLREDDYRFMESQPGYTPKLARELRRNRRRILSAYLRNLGRDFERLHRAARLLALYAPDSNPALVWRLISQSFAFWSAMFEIRLRLMLPAVPVDTAELVRRTAWLRGQVGTYLPGPATS
jgi:hypothetical protein